MTESPVMNLPGSIAALQPLALNLRTAVPDQGDPLLTTWIINWVGYALTHSPMSAGPR